MIVMPTNTEYIQGDTCEVYADANGTLLAIPQPGMIIKSATKEDYAAQGELFTFIAEDVARRRKYFYFASVD